MKYNNIKEGTFLSRPNRFLANVEIDGQTHVCHVKNTGRCRELLVPGARVYLEESDNPLRKTGFDLVSVYKENKLFNIDSSAPNKIFGEWIEASELFGNDVFVKPECKYKNSRFDFYIESGNRRIFAEVKGVTLEENGVMMFPDAPTERGVKHLNELVECVKDGYEGYVVFIIQADTAKYFTPNRKTHEEFADALKNAETCGVRIICLCCDVKMDEITAKEYVEYRI